MITISYDCIKNASISAGVLLFVPAVSAVVERLPLQRKDIARNERIYSNIGAADNVR